MAANDEEAIVQQQKMASLGLLLAGVAHEINNPINFIVSNLPFLEQYIGALERMCDAQGAALEASARPGIEALGKELELDYLRGDAPALLKSIRNGAQRAAAIAADLRIFAWGGDGSAIPVDVVGGLKATLRLVAPLLGGRVRLESRLEPVPPVLGQLGQLNQVFLNVLANAIQALEGKEGTVEVTTRAEGEEVKVIVRDTGVGIAAADRERIFEPFFTTKPVGAGTGLGLAISYGIVRRHGGRIEVESEAGEGSTFTIVLPALK